MLSRDWEYSLHDMLSLLLRRQKSSAYPQEMVHETHVRDVIMDRNQSKDEDKLNRTKYRMNSGCHETIEFMFISTLTRIERNSLSRSNQLTVLYQSKEEVCFIIFLNVFQAIHCNFMVITNMIQCASNKATLLEYSEHIVYLGNYLPACTF